MSTKQPDTLYETRGAAKARAARRVLLQPLPMRADAARHLTQEAQEGKLQGAAASAQQGELKGAAAQARTPARVVGIAAWLRPGRL